MTSKRTYLLQRLPATAFLVAVLVLASCDRTPDGAANSPETEVTIVSEALRFEGEIVDKLPSGLAIRKTAYLRGKKFEWDGEADGRVAEEELEPSSETAPDIDDLSVEELAENLRGVALFAGHRFVEAEPATDLAIEIKKLREMERSGASAEEINKLIPARPTAQGTAEPTLDVDEVELIEHIDQDEDETGSTHEGDSDGAGSNVAFLVHGGDDRRVMDNWRYPHRTHIVFDNTGSTSAINGSQGSGTLIGPSTAMSVAHVFWNEGANTWESDHRWAPGYDSQDSDPSPYGEWYGCYWVTIPTAYTVYENATYDYAVLDFDVGCNSVRNGVNSDSPGATVVGSASILRLKTTLNRASLFCVVTRRPELAVRLRQAATFECGAIIRPPAKTTHSPTRFGTRRIPAVVRAVPASTITPVPAARDVALGHTWSACIEPD